MNQKRRKMISKIITQLEAILDEEDSIRENLPESLETSELYMTSEEASESLNTAIEALQEI